MEKALNLFFLTVSLGYFYFATELTAGSAAAPKAGFLPLVASCLAIVLSLSLTIGCCLRRQTRKAREVICWRGLAGMIAGFFMYVLLWYIAGYFIATFLILIYLLKITDTPGWLVPICISGAVASVCLLLFQQYLGVWLQ